VHEYLYFYCIILLVCYYSLLLSLSSLCPYVTLCLISICQSLRYPILASLMALSIVLRTLLPLHGQFTPPQMNLSPYEVCASVVRSTTLQSIVSLLDYWLVLSHSKFIISLCELDSQFVVLQLSNVYTIQSPTLLWVYLRIRLLKCYFDYIEYQHIPRCLNTLIDALDNYVLDRHLNHL
jgi:hypothetical protein